MNNIINMLNNQGAINPCICNVLNNMSIYDKIRIDNMIKRMSETDKSRFIQELKLCWYRKSDEDYVEGLFNGLLMIEDSNKHNFITNFIKTGAINSNNFEKFGLTLKEFCDIKTSIKNK